MLNCKCIGAMGFIFSSYHFLLLQKAIVRPATASLDHTRTMIKSRAVVEDVR